jgi:hypothetical protein
MDLRLSIVILNSMNDVVPRSSTPTAWRTNTTAGHLAETGLVPEPADSRSPDLLYDREWALALLDATLNRLEKSCRAEGGASAFRVLKPCLTADTARISYQKIAASLGVSEGAARVAVHRLRKRYRQLLREEISRTLADPKQADEELRVLFTTLAG